MSQLTEINIIWFDLITRERGMAVTTYFTVYFWHGHSLWMVNFRDVIAVCCSVVCICVYDVHESKLYFCCDIWIILFCVYTSFLFFLASLWNSEINCHRRGVA